MAELKPIESLAKEYQSGLLGIGSVVLIHCDRKGSLVGFFSRVDNLGRMNFSRYSDVSSHTDYDITPYFILNKDDNNIRVPCPGLALNELSIGRAVSYEILQRGKQNI